MSRSGAELYAGVVVEAPLSEIFHYRVPERLAGRIRPGDRAEIPFARRRTRGVVVSLSPVAPIDPALIKELLDISPEEERIPEDILELSRWVAAYYHCGWGMALAAAIPAGVKHGRRERLARRVELASDPDLIEAGAAELGRRAPKQAAALLELLAWFRGHPGAVLPADCPDLGKAASAEILRQLAKKGLIRLLDAEAAWEDPFPAGEGGEGSSAAAEPVLTAEQTAALAEMAPHVGNGEFRSFLLHGVTGSGKTEVYLRLIALALAAGKSALVLVPEISLTPQAASRFRRRFGEIAVLHSHLGDGERAEHWRRLRSGGVRVAVGARSAVFAPLRNLGVVVVDEEHERTYKQDNDPRYHARDVALMRARLAGALAVLGSATPSLESWVNADSGKHRLLRLTSRPGGARRPGVEVVDIRREWVETGRLALVSRRLERALAGCLERREQAIIFLNRRGFHTSVRCAACGEAVMCGNCDVAMTHHRRAGLLRCGCCGSERGVPESCPACGAASLRFFGAGTERAEDALAGLFPRARLLRMDSDSMRARGAHQSSLAAFARGEYDVLLGTQMVAKGLDFPNVTLVGVLMADAALELSDFRSAERTFQLVAQVIGRAGRAGKAGLAVVQAFQPGHPAVAAAAAQDYAAFVAGELSGRGRLGYPPGRRLARVVIQGGREEAARDAAEAAGRAVRAAMPGGCRLLGPAPCEIERLQGVFRRHMLLFAPDNRILAAWLAGADLRPGLDRGARLILDIDPVSML
ncbi:MAG: primosomal protein N' [Planctomycetota bacterium]|nr:primosomal protein N' [Planctomycetota bacterium]